MTHAAQAAIVAAGTAVVLTPIPTAAVRDLNEHLDTTQPAPTPEPVFDDTLVACVRTALGLRSWRPRPWLGETETRISVWSQLELNDLYLRTGGTVTTAQVEHTSSSGESWTEEEITLTIDVPDLGPVTAVTGWCDDYAQYGNRDELPLMQATTTH